MKILMSKHINTKIHHFTTTYGHPGDQVTRSANILECEVKWALESIITKKASGGDGIPVELFKSRDYFAKKGPSSLGYGFSCGHVWM